MAHTLDSREFVLRNDPKEMYRLTQEFGDQCRRALRISREASAGLGGWRPSSVVLTGLGGSAIGGDVAKALVEAEGSVPFLVNRDYVLPAFVDESTLVFATSYSGNTEETLSAYADAKRRGARIVVVSSGGKLIEQAQADGFDFVQIPAGQPPRTALGFMTVPVLDLCCRFGFLLEQPFDEAFALMDRLAEEWAIEAPFDSNLTKQLAQAMFGKVAVLYGLGGWQAVAANRWKGQINENAKNMVFANAFPELNHNEILGWVEAHRQGVEGWVAVVLQDGRESAKMKERARVTLDLIKDRCEAHTVTAPGETLLERLLGLIAFGDYVSLYLAALNGVDPENIDSINVLKGALAKIP